MMEDYLNLAMQLPVVGIFAYIVFKMLQLAREERKDIHETLGKALDKNTDAITQLNVTNRDVKTAVGELRKDITQRIVNHG